MAALKIVIIQLMSGLIVARKCDFCQRFQKYLSSPFEVDRIEITARCQCHDFCKWTLVALDDNEFQICTQPHYLPSTKDANKTN